FSVLTYLAASAILYRIVRPAFGRLVAMIGLAGLLFLPSLFAWSISALKEPLYFLLTTIGLAAALAIARPGPVARRVLAARGLAVVAIAAQSIRDGGFVMVSASALAGVALALLGRRPRLFAAAAIVLAAVLVVVATKGVVKDRVVGTVRQVAAIHWGHVNTA